MGLGLILFRVVGESPLLHVSQASCITWRIKARIRVLMSLFTLVSGKKKISGCPCN